MIINYFLISETITKVNRDIFKKKLNYIVARPDFFYSYICYCNLYLVEVFRDFSGTEKT